MTERITASPTTEKSLRTVRSLVGYHIQRSVRWARSTDAISAGVGLALGIGLTFFAKSTPDLTSLITASLLTGPVIIGAGIILGRALTASEKPNVKN